MRHTLVLARLNLHNSTSAAINVKTFGASCLPPASKTCHFCDLAVLLAAATQEASRIEDGHHQSNIHGCGPAHASSRDNLEQTNAILLASPIRMQTAISRSFLSSSMEHSRAASPAYVRVPALNTSGVCERKLHCEGVVETDAESLGCA